MTADQWILGTHVRALLGDGLESVEGVVWALDAQRLSSGHAESVDDFRKVAWLGGHTDKILSCAYAAGTGDIVTSGADGNVFCWSTNHIAASSGAGIH